MEIFMVIETMQGSPSYLLLANYSDVGSDDDMIIDDQEDEDDWLCYKNAYESFIATMLF
jgi:hypothetical protein